MLNVMFCMCVCHVTFIYIALLTIQIVSKHLTVSSWSLSNSWSLLCVSVYLLMRDLWTHQCFWIWGVKDFILKKQKIARIYHEQELRPSQELVVLVMCPVSHWLVLSCEFSPEKTVQNARCYSHCPCRPE